LNFPVFILCIYLSEKQLHLALPGILIPDGHNISLRRGSEKFNLSFSAKQIGLAGKLGQPGGQFPARGPRAVLPNLKWLNFPVSLLRTCQNNNYIGSCQYVALKSHYIII